MEDSLYGDVVVESDDGSFDNEDIKRDWLGKKGLEFVKSSVRYVVNKVESEDEFGADESKDSKEVNFVSVTFEEKKVLMVKILGIIFEDAEGTDSKIVFLAVDDVEDKIIIKCLLVF